MQDLSTGSLRRHLTSMTLFMLVGMVMQTLYSLIDLYWVGSLGKEAVAAVSVGGNLMLLSIALLQMLGVGTVALISHATGRKDTVAVQQIFNQALVLSWVIGLLFFGVCFLGSDFYVRSLSSDPLSEKLTHEFLRWFIPAIALQFTMVSVGSALRGIGNMRPGMIAQTGTVLLNIILAPVLIFGWGSGHPLGVEGAALSTFLASAIGVVGFVFYLRRGKTYLKFDPPQWRRPDFALWRRLLGIGLPSGMEFVLLTIYMVVIFAVIKPFGAEAQAGFGIGMRLMQSGLLPAMAISFAVSAIVGQNYGAGRHDRVKECFRIAAIIACSYMALLMALAHIAPQVLVGAFSHDAAVIAFGTDYLRIVSWNFLAMGIVMVASGLFQGLGNTWPSLISSASRLVIMIPAVLWLSQRPEFKINQVWVVSVVAVIVQMLLSLTLLRLEIRRKLRLLRGFAGNS
ncbi:MATE family efflux transporter [Stenotrophobium rhamnosiphilum]|uniref:Multidrug-efflux transporter n=1 Tax=Stenotrophobium rhamnosiphilum TaxID=2029166 RepID=A0A2T5MF07_9GAMM|nr:MATE family efflux transporter [Stenotrophobium rhamnosiphilum]PTU31152.1 MATE family efflux transporter [Stenotrophobium rhamnosiphilum]